MNDGESAETGGRLVDEIYESLTCPDCDYPLRGLPGPELNCPECGRSIDLTQLVAQRWTKPWYLAPKMTRFMLPVAIAFTGSIGCVIASVPDGAGRSRAFWWVFLASSILWLTVAAFSRKYISDRYEAIGLLLVGHVSLALYVVATVLVFLAIGNGLLGFGSGWPTAVFWAVLLLGLATLSVMGGRRGEKLVARRLIREHLRRVSHSE